MSLIKKIIRMVTNKEVAKITNHTITKYRNILHCSNNGGIPRKNAKECGAFLKPEFDVLDVKLDCCPYCGGRMTLNTGRFLMVETYDWTPFRGKHNRKKEPQSIILGKKYDELNLR